MSFIRGMLSPLRGASSRNEIRVLLGAALAFFSVTVSDQPVRGDIVELKDGGVICGKVLNPQSGLMVQIQADDGTLVEVDRKLVKIRISLDRDKKYAEDVKQRGDSLEDHRAIVEQCSAAQMNNIANAHRERIVELDPNDRATWEAMRYYPDEATGKWLRRDVVMYRKGKIKGDKGRWFTWQEKALVDREESMKLQKRDAEREFDVKLKAMESGGPKQKAEAELYFKEVSNPLLVGKLSKMFREGNGAERDLAFQLLKRLPWGVSVPAFVSLAMEDSNRSTVAEILEHLQQGDASVREAVLNAFASKLDNPATRDQAAYCMMPFNDKRYTTTLINYLLSTQIVRPNTPPGGLNASTGSGGVGFSSGGPTAQQRMVQHKDVLSALVDLTGQNFGYNIEEWKRWYALNNAVQNLDLRRDEY